MKKNEKMPEETKQKISLVKIGKPSGMLGKHHSEESKIKMSNAHIGKFYGVYGRTPWNKGIPWSASYKKARSLEKIGEKHPQWKGGDNYTYHQKFYKPLAKSLEQKCSICDTNKKLVTHHIDGNYKHNILSNISILCRGCHTNKLHHIGRKRRKRTIEENKKMSISQKNALFRRKCFNDKC